MDWSQTQSQSLIEQQRWAECCQRGDARSHLEYMELFPNGEHSSQCREVLLTMEDEVWVLTLESISERSLNRYLELFPGGCYVADAYDIIADLPWMEACRLNTLAAYKRYRAEHPYTHCQEVDERIRAAMLHDEVLRKLRVEGLSCYDTFEINHFLQQGVVSEFELSQFFSSEWLQEILNYRSAPSLPLGSNMVEMEDGRAEVYFIGTPASGKTCALGAILSYGNNTGRIQPAGVNADAYRDSLKNTFRKRGISKLPASTAVGSIYPMKIDIEEVDEEGEPNGRIHPVTLVDIAGEIIRSSYYIAHLNDEERRKSLTTFFRALADKKNEKVLFFVVEYGAHDKRWDDNDNVAMADYLQNFVLRLKEKDVFTKSVKGVYILLTKADLIPCDNPETELVDKVREYIEEEFCGFWLALQGLCRDVGIKDLKVYPFSIGEVVAKQLCCFNGMYARNVVNKICEKSSCKKRGWFSR